VAWLPTEEGASTIVKRNGGGLIVIPEGGRREGAAGVWRGRRDRLGDLPHAARRGDQSPDLGGGKGRARAPVGAGSSARGGVEGQG